MKAANGLTAVETELLQRRLGQLKPAIERRFLLGREGQELVRLETRIRERLETAPQSGVRTVGVDPC